MRAPTMTSPTPLTHSVFSLRRVRAGIAALMTAALTACGGGGEITVDPPASAVFVTSPRALPAEYLARQAVAYGPYRTSASAADLANEVITPAMIKEDMDLLVAADIRLIRIFDSGDKVAKQTLDVIVDNNIDMKVQLGAFMGGLKFVANPYRAEEIEAANMAELNRAIALANDPKYQDVILAVSVGNENIIDFSADRNDPVVMARYIKYVRDQVRVQPVTTDDNFQVFSNPIPKVVLDQIDFVAIHAYPVIDTEYPSSPLYWDWKQLAMPAGPARATAMMDASIVELKKQYQATRDALNSVGLSKMPIAITETGWKARLTGNQSFRAHPVNQKMYFERLEAWRQEVRLGGAGPVNIFYFEAFDEPWKLGDDGWGLFDKDRKARYVLQNLFPSNMRANPTLTDADALYFVPPTINAAFAGNAFTLYSDAPGASLVSGFNLDAFDGFTAPRNLADNATAAPGEGSVSMRITPAPANYGWGLLYNPQVSGTTQNLSGFSAVNVWINTTYPGKIEIGLSTLDTDGNTHEAFVQIGNGEYGYCNNGSWCRISIPLAAFLAKNPALDFRLVVNPFYIADRYSFTGKTSGANIQTPLSIDGISWTR